MEVILVWGKGGVEVSHLFSSVIDRYARIRDCEVSVVVMGGRKCFIHSNFLSKCRIRDMAHKGVKYAVSREVLYFKGGCQTYLTAAPILKGVPDLWRSVGLEGVGEDKLDVLGRVLEFSAVRYGGE